MLQSLEGSDQQLAMFNLAVFVANLNRDLFGTDYFPVILPSANFFELCEG